MILYSEQNVYEAVREYAKSVIDSFGTNGVPSSISAIKGMILIHTNGFTDGKEWFQCQYLKVGMHYQDKPEILFEKWHKATVNELMGNILKAINRVSMTE